MKRRISRRAMAQRIAELEAANARLSDRTQPPYTPRVIGGGGV